ncbi:MAG: GNAT family N-acetyltransferase [Parvibaculum sp.]
MSEPVIIQEVGQSHAALIAALHAQCFDETQSAPQLASQSASWSASNIASMFEAPGLIALVARRGDVPLGFVLARYIAGDAEILSVGVLPEARGAGLGETLLEGLHHQLQGLDAKARILLDVAADNGPALALYAKAGYRQVGHRKAYYRRTNGVFIDSLTMVRERA